MSAASLPAWARWAKAENTTTGFSPPAVAALLSAFAVGAATWTTLAFSAAESGTARSASAVLWIRALAGVAMVVPSAVLLIGRARATRAEREIWRPVATAACVIGAGFATQTVLVAVGSDSSVGLASWQAVPFELATMIAGPFIYWGLVQWNRVRMAFTNGADWLNGLTAVLALTAVGNLAIHGGTTTLSQWPWWQLQGWLIGMASGVVLLGAAMTIGMLGRAIRDVRPWLICLALALVMGTQLTSFGSHSLVTYGSWPQTGWLLSFGLIAWVSVWKPKVVRSEAVTTMSTAIGMMVVLTASMVTLAFTTEFHNGSRVSALYAIAAFAGSSTQAARIIRDLSQLAQTRQEARTDELTGTANRRALLAHLEAAVSTRTEVCLLLLDLNRFKDVNDQHGHAIGDLLLRRVSERLDVLVPPRGLLARLGGDEFAVVLKTHQVQDATALAAALLGAISAVVEIDGRRLSVGASIGISELHLDAATGASEIEGGELLRRADVAMYVAKQDNSGFSVYHAAVDGAAREHVLRLEELKAVLADTATASQRAELVVYYQAKLNASTRAVVGAEALVRWQHPRLGLIGPDSFLDLAEDNGLMGRLTARVLHEACVQAMTWRSVRPSMRIAVNLSTSSLTDPALLPLIDRVLAESGLDARALTVEITETTFMADPEWCLETMQQIADLGIGVSIDDYGTGYSSLAYLSDLPATELKLDRSLTARITTDKRTAAVVAGTIELAHRLDLRLVAEGVEDEATLTALCALNCDEVQGYLFGKPAPAELLDVELARPLRPPLALVGGGHRVPRQPDRSAG